LIFARYRKTAGLIFWLALLALILRIAMNLKADGSIVSDTEPQIVNASGTALLKTNKRGHFVSKGFINGKPVKMLLDTGATLVTVPQALAQELSLSPRKPVTVHTAGGASAAHLTVIEAITVGGITMRNVRAHIATELEGRTVLLGMSFLRHVELIQSENQLKLQIRK